MADVFPAHSSDSPAISSMLDRVDSSPKVSSHEDSSLEVSQEDSSTEDVPASAVVDYCEICYFAKITYWQKLSDQRVLCIIE